MIYQELYLKVIKENIEKYESGSASTKYSREVKELKILLGKIEKILDQDNFDERLFCEIVSKALELCDSKDENVRELLAGLYLKTVQKEL